MTEWMTIDTAPTDGSEIDIWLYCHDVKWRPDGHGIENGQRVADARWNDEEWQAKDDRADDWVGVGNDHYTISHWMPKPAPPHS